MTNTKEPRQWIVTKPTMTIVHDDPEIEISVAMSYNESVSDPGTTTRVIDYQAYLALQEKLRIAQTALEFYAEEDHWSLCLRKDGVYVLANSEGTSIIEEDKGQLAREALALINKTEGEK